MLNFFDETLAVERADGSPILELGDCIIMDNCGFHHGHQVEPLQFVPACFNQVKCYLKQNTSLTLNETEIAIGDRSCFQNRCFIFSCIFRNCGYL